MSNIVDFPSLVLTPDRAERAESDVLNALINAKDNAGNPLVAEAVNGFDAVLLDSIFGTPNADSCPFIGLNTWVSEGEEAVGGHEVNRPYIMSLYFVYYYGNPATSGIPFYTQRARHLAACLTAIEMQTGGNMNATISGGNGWLWNSRYKRHYDYFSPFRYINESYQMPDGYNCVRVDKSIKVVFSRP